LEQALAELRWGVERRLEFIEFRLYWEGGINRSDITAFFGVSVPQASKDLSQYQELAPGNMDYDKSGKRYLASGTFKPRFLRPEADTYLAQMRSIAERIVKAEETWLAHPPSFDAMPVPHRRVDPEILRTVLRAIRDQSALDVRYQSMNPKRPDPVWRGISPHAFASDGFRWHVRAYCHLENKFKDFLLSRCIECRLSGEAKAKADTDDDWNERMEVRLKANPKLSKAQQQIIAHDFGLDNENNVVLIRKALLYYFHKRLRLDVAEALDDPHEAPVVVANRAEFDKALAETGRRGDLPASQA
jgi:predicted DNA-binding transcriptional regulator YafY